MKVRFIGGSLNGAERELDRRYAAYVKRLIIRTMIVGGQAVETYVLSGTGETDVSFSLEELEFLDMGAIERLP